MNQRDLEATYSKTNTHKYILDHLNYDDPLLVKMTEEIQEYRDTLYSYESKNIRVMKLDIMSEEIVLHIISAVATIQEVQPVAGVCTILGNLLGFKNTLEGVKTSAELLAVSDGHYFNLYPWNHADNNTGTMGIKSKLVLPIELRNLLNNIQFIPPMIQPPRNWTSNSTGGFHTIKKSNVLGRLNQHNDFNGLTATNILQKNTYVLNEHICNMEETSKSVPKTIDQIEQIKKFFHDSAVITKQYLGKKFFFMWQDDKRGRKYSHGYHLNPQGSEYKKAQIDWADKQVLT